MKRQKGFTLIELLIVIAILGIMAAVIIPNVTRFISNGHLAAANSEVATLNTAIYSYQADYVGAFPDSISDLDTQIIGTLKGTYVMENGALKGIKYLTDNFIWVDGKWERPKQ